jgi:hypothetical protein
MDDLRAHGVGILNGQIEDLCVDGTFSANKKLSLASVFDLNQRLVNGEDIRNVFDTADIGEFLKHILTTKSE